ncbi:MAG: response regulator [Phycisphaerae bacterium]|nr:response regulator [Phycisphaerae bacterium]MCZ2400611.1 response regulator [Phycisphaerae bacterium]NUQ49870.1 response regulator [Phycisphaerae bacterium]
MRELTVGRIRKSDDEIRQVLDDLDRQATNTATPNVRESDRFKYRACAIAVEFLQAGQKIEPVSVTSRNISRHGLGFLIGKYVHPGTECRVSLVTLHSYVHKVDGTVVRCRYVPNSGSVYDVGVRFPTPLDVSIFHRGAARMRVLVADQSPTLHKLVARLLGSFNVELTSTFDGADALEKVAAARYGLVLIDLDLPGTDGTAVVREMRERGYIGHIVGMGGVPHDEARQKLIEAGCDDFVPKPFPPDALAKQAAAQVDEPLISTLADDADLAPVIDDFVAALPRHVAALETAFAEKDTEQIRRTAASLYGEAAGFGFATIGETALHVLQAVAEGAAPALLRPALQKLLRAARCARPSTVVRQCAD